MVRQLQVVNVVSLSPDMQGARALWKLIAPNTPPPCYVKLSGIRQSKRIEWDFFGQNAASSMYYMIIYR